MASIRPCARFLAASRRPTAAAQLIQGPQVRCASGAPIDRHVRGMEDSARRKMNQQGMGPSYRVGSMESMREESGELLLPSTFIVPPMSRRPSLFTDTRNRLKFEKVRLQIKIQNLVSRILARVWHKDPLFRRNIIPTAEALHRNMYTAYANGDVATIASICARDLATAFRTRITSRPANVRYSWQFLGYNRRSKIVSHKLGMLSTDPKDENSVRQVVVRIDSTQKLTKGVDGKVVKGSGEAARTTEYVVLHKRRRQGRPETDWVVWGTIPESTMDDVRAHGQPVGSSADGNTVAGSSARWG
ncbi:hypothetical protein Dda_0263 [Drechslerella dactyloides]|uniref:Large ribosomal subunit protein mL45 n=1 Tax=Drechslerella dactyloides TaxID=74499 RepID=A0AAD6J7N2_DREDA|nr:hypothetical protein Dda_0263 [Drechslerella dactyloides]